MAIEYKEASESLLKNIGFYNLTIDDFVGIARDYEATGVLKTKLMPNPERIYAFAKAFQLISKMTEERHGKIEWEVFYHGGITATLDRFSVEGFDYETFCMIVNCCSALNISATFHKLEIDLLIPDLFFDPIPD